MRFAPRVAMAACTLAMAGISWGQAASAPPGPSSRARPAMIFPNDPACRPEYPAAAVRALAQGTTIVEFSIAADGRLLSAAIVGGSGTTPEHALLDQTALTALSRCSFRPGADEQGRPTGTQVRVSYTWKLE